MEVGTFLRGSDGCSAATRILREIRLLPRLSFSLELARQISPREILPLSLTRNSLGSDW